MKITTLLCLALPLLAAGCNTGIRDPIARVSAVNVVEQTSEGSRVEVTVELANPNRDPLPLIKSDYRVAAGGGEAFSATERLHRTIPSRGRQVIVLPAVFRGSGGSGANAGANYRVNGSVTYEPPGEIRRGLTEAGIPLPWETFEGTGQLGEGPSTYTPAEAEATPTTQPSTQPEDEF